MKSPDDIRQQLHKRYKNKLGQWLGPLNSDSSWPLEFNLQLPSEHVVLRQPEAVGAWITAWRNWQRVGVGTLIWCERRWRTAGIQQLPERLILNTAAEVVSWIGEATRWQRACSRFEILTTRWPALQQILARHFDLLADYSDADFRRLQDLLVWLNTNPRSGVYPRQVPIAGLDSKWLEKRKGVLTDFLNAIAGINDQGFFQASGLRVLPQLIRMRILDDGLRQKVAGLGDITSPVNELIELELSVQRVFVVENVQTLLAFPDIQGSIVIGGQGYNVGILQDLPWIMSAECIYWGDLDTHGFAILSKARNCFPKIRSILMDEETLLAHKSLWVKEEKPHGAGELPQLSTDEQAVYRKLTLNYWGQNIRLEQERIAWDYAITKLAAVK